MASGPAGRDRSPAPVLPPGLRLLRSEGAGEVQTPLTGPGTQGLAPGDRVWLRHAKAGEVMERFAEVVAVRDGGAEVMAVIYKPGLQTVEVRQGDNRGQAVRHINVVRQVRRLGDWTGRPVLFILPTDSTTEDNVVVLVQSKADRRILSAARRAERGVEPARD